MYGGQSLTEWLFENTLLIFFLVSFSYAEFISLATAVMEQ